MYAGFKTAASGGLQGGMDKYDSFTMVLADMIDTWLFTALVLGILALCVILRGIPARSTG